MIRFYATTFTVLVANLQHAEGLFAVYGPGLDRDDPLPPDVAAKIEEAVRSAAAECDTLPVSISLRRQFDRVTGWLDEFRADNDVLRGVLMTYIGELKQNVIAEMSQHLCLLVPAELKAAYVEPEKWFGENISDAFPDARPDILGCVRCFALDQWNASVYHAMGVAQHGLYWLASYLDIPFDRPIELANWKNIIDPIEKAIRAMEQKPKTVQRDEDLRFFANAASHFFYIKEAWRNHIMHARARYDEVEARRVMEHVRDMMGEIAVRRGNPP